MDVGAGVGKELGTAVLHRTIAHSALPWLAAPLIYQSIPKHGSRKSTSRCPSLMGYLGVAVLGVAELGTAGLHPPPAFIHTTLAHAPLSSTHENRKHDF